MKQNRFIVLLVIIAFGFTNCQRSKPNIYYQKKYVKEIKQARKEAGFFISRNFIPGSSVAIFLKNELIYSEGFGLASTDLEVPVTRKTKFRIGDLSELYTSALYLKLLDEGLLNEDSAIQKYYPQFPEKEDTITPKFLAYEIAGIRKPTAEEQLRKGMNTGLERSIDRFKNDPLIVQPGTYQIPSIFNYNLLGVVMEKASGKRFAKLFQEYITDTLHLENTCIDNPFISIKNRSDFFETNLISQVVFGQFYDLRQNAPSEGMLSNAEDLAKLGNDLLHSDYFSGIRDKIFQNIVLENGQQAGMANAWTTYTDHEERLVYGRQGTVPGGGGSIIIYPEYELIIAFTCNLTASLDETPVFSMALPFLPKTQQETENK
ncbi:MAG: serine hydrolase domain-containing protein [Draconibacterium sp.]